MTLKRPGHLGNPISILGQPPQAEQPLNSVLIRFPHVQITITESVAAQTTTLKL